ncbi:hypothetical protein ACQR0Z_16565 [Bradyrhizobium sp. HKCCYLS3077]|uniref:DUF7919 family protein n=1 Tax=Bradyrhizobium sp. HKCCYLS3077 TaxID=3420761 RepID=UPI003EBC8C8A
MYFPDLTPYTYGGELEPKVLNIGWLSATHPFTTGPRDDQLTDALRQLRGSPVNLYRGYHCCEFCDPPPLLAGPNGMPIVEAPPEILGNGEIRITGPDGTRYAAPVLILHYVTAHGYRPPQPFIEAAIAAAAQQTR